MVERVLEVLEDVLPLDELDRIFLFVEEVGDFMAIDAVTLALEAANLVGCLEDLRLILADVLQERERTDNLLGALDKQLRQRDRAAHRLARPVHHDALQGPLQIVHTIIEAIGQRVDILAVNRRDEGQIQLIDDLIVYGIGCVLEVNNFLHLVSGLAVIQHDFVHHECTLVEILGAFYEQVKELAVLLLELKHLLLRPPRS